MKALFFFVKKNQKTFGEFRTGRASTPVLYRIKFICFFLFTKRRFYSLLALLLLPVPAFAWGREGHAVIADIAQAHLSPAAFSAVSLLLEDEGLTELSEISSWADDVRKQRPETAPWHYVDIPLSAPAYVAARDCPGGDCVVAKIDQYRAVLANKSAPAADRLEALKWVVHFVGDVHQPLHDEDNNDKGGNEVIVQGFAKPYNLHWIWDTTMIEAQNPDAVSLAAALDAAITPSAVAEWDRGGPADWANQAHLLAQPAYALLGNPAPGSTVTVTGGYVDAEQRVIDLQLERAGIRLADLLNQALQ